jgi:hypothetical protein
VPPAPARRWRRWTPWPWRSEAHGEGRRKMMTSGVHTSAIYREKGGGVVLSIRKYDNTVYACRWVQYLSGRIPWQNR